MSATNAFDVAPIWKSVASIAFVAGGGCRGEQAYRIDEAGMGEVGGGR